MKQFNDMIWVTLSPVFYEPAQFMRSRYVWKLRVKRTLWSMLS